MTSGVHMIVLVGWMITLLVLYHKVFEVYYFDLGHGFLKELGVSFILGLIMTTLTFYFWWLTAIVIIITGLSLKKKIANNAPLVIAIVLAIIVAFMGISDRNDNGSDSSTTKASSIRIVKELVC